MKVTKNLEIGLNLVLGLRKSSKPITLAEIANFTGDSLYFLEQIARKLRMAGIVNSVRGPGGGYVLASSRPYTAKEVADALGIKNKASGDLSLPANQLRNVLANAYNQVTV